MIRGPPKGREATRNPSPGELTLFADAAGAVLARRDLAQPP
jgi:hypothetical protein